MKTVNKYLLSGLLLLMAGLFFFFYRMYQRDIKVLNQFLISYGKAEDKIFQFSLSLLGTNRKGSPTFDQFNKIAGQLSKSTNETKHYRTRRELAKEALLTNTILLDSLAYSNDLESKTAAVIAQLDSNARALSTVSSLIKSDAELRHIATEIVDLSKKEFYNLSEYKKTNLTKRTTINTLLQNVAENNTDAGKLTMFLILDSNLFKKSEDINRLNSKRNNANTHFRKLAGLNN